MMELRLLGPLDAPDLAVLEETVFDDPWPVDRFVELLASPRFVAVGACDGSQLHAYVTAYNVAGEAEIVNLAVTPDRRGQGLGKGLLQYFLHIVHATGTGRVVLEVRSGNESARRLYASCGFVQAGLRRGYYDDGLEDALILECPLCPGS